MATIIGMKGINTMPIGYTVEEKVRPKGDTFKLIYYPSIHVKRLYNLKNDPNEMNDLAKNPEYAPKIKTLTAELKQLCKQMDDPLKF